MTELDIDFGSDIGEKDSDYQLSLIPVPPFKHEDFNIEYNQKDVNAYACTIYGAMGCVSDLTGYVFTIDEQKEIFNQAVKLGLDPNFGWSLSSAVDLVRNWWNKNKEKKLLSFRVDRNSDKFWEAYELGYSMAVAFRGNSAYNKDKNDGTLDNTNFGLTNYGHITRTAKLVTGQNILDNYKGIKHNKYIIPKDHWNDLANFYASAYLYVVADDYRRLNEQYQAIPTWAEAAWDKYSDLFDKPEPSKEVDVNQIQWVFHKLGFLQKPTEPLTQARLTVLINNLLK